MEMEGVRRRLAQGQRVQVQVVRGPIESEIELAQRCPQGGCEAGKLLGGRSFERRLMRARQDQKLEWCAGRVRRQDDGEVRLQDEARSIAHLLVEDVAVDAALAGLEMPASAFQLALQLHGHNGQREELRVGM